MTDFKQTSMLYVPLSGTANELNYIPKESITRGVIAVSSILGKANLFQAEKKCVSHNEVGKSRVGREELPPKYSGTIYFMTFSIH